MSSNQFTQFFSGGPPPNQFAGAPSPAPPRPAPGGPSVDQLTNQLEYSYIDIPHLLSQSDEEEEQLPELERQRRRLEKQRREAARRQAALKAALAGQGVVGAAPGFDPRPYQQHLQHLALQQQQEAVGAAAAAAAQEQQQQQHFSFGQQQQQQQQQQFGFGQPPFGR